ncbi:MAG: hypothetical protein ACYC4R_12090 [Anaerolineae bacterium]
MEQRNKYASLFMLAGIAIGAGLGVTLFAITGNAVYIAMSGAGAGVGLAIGAGVDKSKAKG